MKLPVRTAAAAVIATIAGIASAQWTMSLRAGETQADSWRSSSGTGADNDPYVVANALMSGRLPQARDQIAEWQAMTDGQNQTLNGSCSYTFTLKTEGVRWWSLSTTRGGALASPSIVAAADGAVVIGMTASPVPGNWLEAPGGGAFRLTLRLLREPETDFAPPVITRGRCF